MVIMLGVIPARGGSKGIPHKNIKMLNGKPLIAYTIEAAQESNLLSKFVVSTDDNEIAKISKDYGAEVLMRPPELATDESKIVDTLKHIQKQIPFDSIVLLQPTSPFRNKGRIDECIKHYLEYYYFHSVATGFMCKFQPYGTNTQRRQDYDGWFYDDGSIYVIYDGLIRQGKLFDEKVGHVLTTKEENIEIDDEFDFWLCEQILRRREEK